MIIKILGTGCSKCDQLEKLTKEVVAANGVDAEVVKVKEIKDIMAYGVMKTPALVVDERVKVMGRIPSADEIKKMIGL